MKTFLRRYAAIVVVLIWALLVVRPMGIALIAVSLTSAVMYFRFRPRDPDTRPKQGSYNNW